MENLLNEWLEAKETERAAIERRREIEDELTASFALPEGLEGTETRKSGAYVVKIVGRLDRKVDSDALQEIAAEHGLSDHLSTLFRWKPEIDMRKWKAADQSITGVLSGAITTKPGRPSYSISIKE